MVGANLYGISMEAVLELWTERHRLSRLQRYPALQGGSMIVLAECRSKDVSFSSEFRW